MSGNSFRSDKICAVIQAGGMGSRVRELTKEEIPKPMLEINGKPMIEWQIEELRSAGITNIVIVVGHLGEFICDYFADGRDWNVEIKYIKETSPLGSAGALSQLSGTYGKEKTFEHYIVVFGDVMFSVDWSRAFSYHSSHGGDISLFAHPNAHPYDSDLLVVDDRNCVKSVLSKKEERIGWYDNLVNAGLYIINAGVINFFKEEYHDYDVKLDMESDIVMPNIEKGKVFSYKTTEYIKDVGTPERFEAACKEQKEGLWTKKNLTNKQCCVFLDRDGTINVHRGLINCDEKLELIAGAAKAIKKINEAGLLAILVTNQPVIARGMCTVEDVKDIHRKLQVLLGEQGAYLDDIIFCPHHPDKGYPEENPKYKIKCNCRKPATGMIDEMVSRYNIDCSRSFIVGDSTVDIKTGENVGLRTVLVGTGEAGKDRKYDVKPGYEVSDLLEAASQIIKSADEGK